MKQQGLISRRSIDKLLLAMGLAMTSAAPAFGASNETTAPAPAVQKVSFKNNNGITIVGNLHFPSGFKKGGKYPALVTVPPAGGAKEQTAGLYARKMAAKGFLAIAIDASFQGESGGLPRFKEDPNARVEDIRGAVDYLVGLPYVDEARIGVLGICAGG
ncbi:MAG TPA: alpha/beta hydrolase, partial [Burkholderiaceae bacterium]|nr:alpha/beta hydrolase [Burkholderiaceae bacterium]